MNPDAPLDANSDYAALLRSLRAATPPPEDLAELREAVFASLPTTGGTGATSSSGSGVPTVGGLTGVPILKGVLAIGFVLASGLLPGDVGTAAAVQGHATPKASERVVAVAPMPAPIAAAARIGDKPASPSFESAPAASRPASEAPGDAPPPARAAQAAPTDSRAFAPAPPDASPPAPVSRSNPQHPSRGELNGRD